MQKMIDVEGGKLNNLSSGITVLTFSDYPVYPVHPVIITVWLKTKKPENECAN
jgi:hypothetical protein